MLRWAAICIRIISQIPKFPSGYTVEDVLRTAFSVLTATKKKMEALEAAMAQGATQEQLREYDTLVNRFQSGGGYDMDVDVDKICNGLGITAEQRPQLFDSLSGGEKTRINLARLLLEKTDILLLDEPTTALDVTIQAQILELLKKLNRESGISMLFISHNLNGVRKLCTRTAVMQRGVLVEEGDIETVFRHPRHPYTQRLIAAIPTRHRKEETP